MSDPGSISGVGAGGAAEPIGSCRHERAHFVCDACGARIEGQAPRPLRGATDPVRSLGEAFPDVHRALKGMLDEWERMTCYGSPLAKAANQRVAFARRVLARLEGRRA
jgi:hypothetical protein